MQKVLDNIIQYIYNHFITPTTMLDQYGRLGICPSQSRFGL